MDSVLDLNGVAFSNVSDMLIEGDGSEAIGDTIRYYWEPTTAARSSCGNTFRNIMIQGVRCKTGVRIGLPGSAAQVDTTSYENITAAGQWSPGQTEWWQAGFAVGSGTYGNNLSHHFWNAGATFWAAGFQVSATHFLLTSGTLGANDVDFACNTLGYFSVQGVRCEVSRRLLTNGLGPTQASANFSLSDVVWASDRLDPDGGLIVWDGMNGHLSLRNIVIPFPTSGARIIAKPYMGMTLDVSGLTCAGSPEVFLSGLSPKVRARLDGMACNKPDGSGWEGMASGIVMPPALAPSSTGPISFPGLGKLESSPDGRLVWTPHRTRRPVVIAAPK
jgi:hypothetical protein